MYGQGGAKKAPECQTGKGSGQGVPQCAILQKENAAVGS